MLIACSRCATEAWRSCADADETLWAASIRYLLRHPAQLALALLGLGTGRGDDIAVDIATASSGRAFELSMEAVNGAATHEIRGGPGGVDEPLYVHVEKSASPLR